MSVLYRFISPIKANADARQARITALLAGKGATITSKQDKQTVPDTDNKTKEQDIFVVESDVMPSDVKI